MPRNAWYVAAHPDEVRREPLARDILSEPVVLYRREDGCAVAVGGRCPHRHYPLGCGTVRGDAIVCGYHGMAFGDDGRCLSIPSQTNVPAPPQDLLIRTDRAAVVGRRILEDMMDAEIAASKPNIQAASDFDTEDTFHGDPCKR